MILQLQSEPYSPHGNISGEGVGKILGTPKHDRLRILIRETVQNSWDARREGNQAIYTIRLRKLLDAERQVYNDSIFGELPPDRYGGRVLKESLQRSELWVLDIIDAGTSGLGGPTRADIPVNQDESTDFIDFVRNIGSPRDKKMGGGTYGYGKSSLYALSRCQTICIHTQAKHSGKPVERFIACRIGEPYQLDTIQGYIRYTGRHWWGHIFDDIVEPIENAHASAMADISGIPSRSSSLPGTTISILDPELDYRSPAQAVDSIIETLVWYFWPKMISMDSKPPAMQFRVEFDGLHVPIPKLNDCPPIPAFVEAMQKLKQGESTKIECRRPNKFLGHLAIAKTFVRKRRHFNTGDNNQSIESVIPPLSSHIALMRPAELVVKYMQGPSIPSDLVEYGGVFICDDEVEKTFAKAEPPAHDDWIPGNLEGTEKTFVRVALRRIKEIQYKEVQIGTPDLKRGKDKTSTGLISDILGNLVVGVGSEKVEQNPKSKNNNNQKKKVIVSNPVASGFQIINSIPCALFLIKLNGEANTKISIKGTPKISLEGGQATENPSGVGKPVLVCWLDNDLSTISDKNIVHFKTEKETSIYAAVSLSADCAVELSLEVEIE